MMNRFILLLGLFTGMVVTQAAAQEQESPPAESVDLSGNPIEYEILGEGSIIIKATEEDLAILEALISQLDQEIERPVIEFLQLDNAPAKDVAAQLQKIFKERVKSARPEDKISIVADEGSNSLIILAPQWVMPEILELAIKLDKAPRLGKLLVETLQLEFIPAIDAAPLLELYLEKLKKQPGKAKAIEQISIVPNERNNTLVITAMPEEIEQLKKIIEVYDVEPTELAVAKLLFIPLLNARAEELAKSLNEMLEAQGEQAQALKETILRLRVTHVGPDGRLMELPELDLDKPIRIVPEPGTNSLIIATSDKNVEPITAVVKLLDTVPTAADMAIQFFPLKYADAEAIAEMMKEMFEAGSKLPQVPGKEIKGAVPEDIAGKAFVYNVGIHADTRTNTLVISGRPEQLAIAHTIVNQMDVEGDFFFGKPSLFYLEHTDAERLAKILTDLNEKSVKSLEERKAGASAIEKERALIISDTRSNALIISATDTKFKELTELARKLDSAPGRWINEIRIINCRQTSAGDLGSKIEQLWERKAELRKHEDLPLDKPIIVADPRSNSLVIASNIEDFEAIKQLVMDLESQPLAPMAMIRLIKVQNNDAGALGTMLKGIFEERMQQRQTEGGKENPADKVAIATDPATNTMLVAASPENFAEITRLVAELDVIPELEGVIRTFQLKYADAPVIADKIKELIEQGIYKPGATGEGGAVSEAREKISIISDVRSNSILVSASKPNMAIVQQLIEEMDSKEIRFTGDTAIFKLIHTDALKAADILTQVFAGFEAQTLKQEVFITPTIIPVESSNALIVAGSRDGIVRIKDLLAKIDKPSTSPTAQFEVYTLKHASSIKLAPKMMEMFEKRVSGAEGQRTPIHIQAIEGSNSLVVSASADDHIVFRELVELLDVKSNLNQQLRIFNLETAKAENTASVLTDLFQFKGEGGDGLANAIAVQPVPWTNSILVWASAGQMEDIAQMISKLDTNVPTRELMFDVIQLKQAMAEDLAEAINETFQGEVSGQAADMENAIILSFFEKLDDGTQALRKLIRQDITIIPYVPTNALLVMAPPESVDMLRSLILQLDGIPPITADVKIFKLFNANAEQMIETLEQIFEAEATGAGGDEIQTMIGGIEGASIAVGEGGGIRQQLNFASDQRTNSIIVAGNKEYLSLVAKLIEQLDAEAAEDREIFVYRVKNTEASAIKTAIEGLNESETQRLSELEDVTSALRRADETITIIEDEETNSVIIGASSKFKSQYMDIVRELDRAPDQVLIEVMLIEVTLDDRFELGIEFAAQDLLFSEKAFIGPNGTIMGPEFDFVAGTDLGAIGSGGGFSFTMTGEDFNFLFHAMQSAGRAELISRPSIMVENNETGTIEIITEQPVPSGTSIASGGTQTTTVTYQDAGITLEVEPSINPDGFVQLLVKPEVSSIGAPVQIGGGLQAFSFNRTRLETTITIKDGDTVIIGGLIETSLSESEGKVPVVGDIPVIGQLFRSNQDSKRQKELLIVITATVIRSEEDAYRLSVQQRDQTDIIPDKIKMHPLMNKLQLQPGEAEMLIQDKDLLIKPKPEEQYGPRPSKIYGPPTPQRQQQVSLRDGRH